MKKSDEDYKSYQEELQRQVEDGDRKDAERHDETSSVFALTGCFYDFCC
jgi:hypothetical protein